jgi:hypothetical protein
VFDVRLEVEVLVDLAVTVVVDAVALLGGAPLRMVPSTSSPSSWPSPLWPNLSLPQPRSSPNAVTAATA